jgi:hypothetical protein
MRLVQTEPWDHLRRELDRARRYGREFALLRLSGDDVEREAALLGRLRTSDYVWAHGKATYVLLPEADRTAAEGLVARLEREAPGLLPERGVQLAAFPGDGLTSGALLAAVRGRPIARLPQTPVGSAAALNGHQRREAHRGNGQGRTSHRELGLAQRVAEPAH